MRSRTLGEAQTSRGPDVARALRALLDQLDAELRHPELKRHLSELAVRGVTLATGWSLQAWREHVDAWCAAMERPEAEASAALRPDAAEWSRRLRKLRSFLATAGREARHISDSAAEDPDAIALFGKAGQDVVTAALEWFAVLSGADQPASQVASESQVASDSQPAPAAAAGSGPAGAPAEVPAVEIRELEKRYGDVKAVDGVSLTIPAGQVFGLLGPNSAGKTTLIECVEGIRNPDSGSISVLGLRHRDGGKEIRTRTGVQLQKTGFYDLLNLRETLELYAAFYPRPLDIDELMTRLQIRDKAKTLVKDMSGGILQRMSLGVALVNDPELIFLDEPTTGLDPQARRVIWEVIRSLKDEGRTVVLTTHYMEEAEQLCDQVAIMTAGRLRAQGTPGELIRRYVGETIVDIGPADGFDEAAARALDGVRRCDTQGGRLVLQADDPAGLLTTILALPKPPADARIRRGTLEDVFLEIVESLGTAEAPKISESEEQA